MPSVVDTLSLGELVGMYGKNEREMGKEQGWTEAATFLRKKAGEIFAEGGKDALAGWFRTAAEHLTEQSVNLRNEKTYTYGIPEELLKRLEALEKPDAIS